MIPSARSGLLSRADAGLVGCCWWDIFEAPEIVIGLAGDHAFLDDEIRSRGFANNHFIIPYADVAVFAPAALVGAAIGFRAGPVVLDTAHGVVLRGGLREHRRPAAAETG